MEVLSASQIIGVWERGVSQHQVDRALTMLAAARPDSWDSLAELGIGRRDAGLLRLRERIFGATLQASAQCPRCAQSLEFSLHTTELSADASEDSAGEPLELPHQGTVVRFRMPNSLDLRAASHCGDVAEARTLLLNRCLLGSKAEALPEPLLTELADRLSRSDPFADVTLALQCVACAHSWMVIFDIATFLWNEIDALARRLMLEVVKLAGAFGWSESDILAMSAARRQYYLEMAG